MKTVLISLLLAISIQADSLEVITDPYYDINYDIPNTYDLTQQEPECVCPSQNTYNRPWYEL